MAQRNHIADNIIEVCQRLYAKGFVAATDGNVSARMDNGRILCTPTGQNKGDLVRDDLVLVDMSGKALEGNVSPSTEIQMHLRYYRARSDVQSVVHAHAPYCTGFATTGQGLTGCVLPEIIVSLGSIPLAPYATPSTSEVPDSIAPYVDSHDVILLQNHGVVAAGTSPLNAYYTLEKTEHAAHILFIARVLGGENRLTADQVDNLKHIAGSSYGIDVASRPACIPAEHSNLDAIDRSPQANFEVKGHILRAINELGL